MYLDEWDPWARRFNEAGGTAETFSWRRIDGELRSLKRSTSFEDPADLGGFFADTDLTVQFDPHPRESEFAIFPGPPSRASENQRRQLEDLLGSWSAAVVRYLEEVRDLYRYLDHEPKRAKPVFRAIFDDDDPGLRADEEARLDRLVETFLGVMEIAGQTEGGAESLDQLTRLVYDPFPADFAVAIEGRVLAFEGFVEKADGSFAVPPLGLEHALVALERVWVQPPLLTTYERLERLDEEAAPTVKEFARARRTVAALPTAREVSEALEEALAPEPEYRLRWRPRHQPVP